jgi:hypothetical protein
MNTQDLPYFDVSKRVSSESPPSMIDLGGLFVAHAATVLFAFARLLIPSTVPREMSGVGEDT